MGNIQFKCCVNCGEKRAWHLRECSSCNKTEYDISNGNGGKLLQDAIGDSVSELVLFETEAPLFNLSERGRISSIIPARVQEQVDGVTTNILHNPISHYLNPGEQPHFVLKANGAIQRETAQEVSKIEPSDEFNASRIVVTDERIIFLIGQEKGDVVVSCSHSDILDADFTSGILRTTISINSEDASYQISD